MMKHKSLRLKKGISLLLTLVLTTLVFTNAAPPVSASRSGTLDDLEQQLNQTE